MMQLARSLPILFTFALIGMSTCASVAAEKSRGQEWIAIIEGLTSSGITKVGPFDLKEFKDEALQIKWDSIDGAPASVLSGSRESAYYLWNEKKVFLSDKMPTAALSSLPQLELHEALGATGNNDHNYALSTALMALSRTKSGHARTALLNSYARKLFPMQLASLGGTGVSGGGDLATLYIKDRVLQLVMKTGASTEFLTEYPLIDFEPLNSQSISRVTIDYTLLRVPDATGQRESFAIYVPMKIWNEGDRGRAELVREIAQKITDIFPANAGVAKRTFVPFNCSSQARTVTFPASSDASINSIQDLRGAARLGCVAWFPGDQKVERMSPAVDRIEQPREAGSFGYKCSFHYGDASESYQVSITAGTGNTGASGWSTDGTDFIDGWHSIDGNGKLRWTALTYSSADGKIRTKIVPNAAKDATHGSSRLEINGKTMTYECVGGGLRR